MFSRIISRSIPSFFLRSHPSAAGFGGRHRFLSAAPPNLPLFDTHKLVSTLKESGFNESQSISIMNALVKAMQDMSAVNQQTQATKAEFTALQSEINEKIFNLTLKFDMQTKHIKEINQKDFLALKNDVLLLQKTTQTDISALKTELHMMEKSDFTALNTEIAQLRAEIEKNYTNMKGEVKDGENRMIKYALGFLGSFGALGLGAYRAMSR